MLGSHRTGNLVTRQGMESDGCKKGFPREVLAKLRTKRQVTICPAKTGGDASTIAKAHRLHRRLAWSSTRGGKRDAR